jgi:hypothetical protein
MSADSAWCYGSGLAVESDSQQRCPFCGDLVDTLRGLLVEHRPEPWTCTCGAGLAGSTEMLAHMDSCADWSASATYSSN